MIVGVLYSPLPPRECVVRCGCGCQSWAGVGAIRESAACGRARIDAVGEMEMVQPLDGVHMELC
jgi:hypothetical protein